MRSSTLLRKQKMSKERVLALDEILPNHKPTHYDSSPGVYIRSDKDRELDALWQGFKINCREEKSPGFYLSVGFITGALCTIMIMAVLNIGSPNKESFAELNLWKTANTKAAVNLAPPSQDSANPSFKTTEYKVQGGDTLGAIAFKFYGTSDPAKISKIQEFNNLKSPDDIKIDQTLLIPTEE